MSSEPTPAPTSDGVAVTATTDRTQQLLALLRLNQQPDAEVARAVLEIVRRAADGSIDRLRWHDLGVLLEQLKLGAVDEDVWDALVGSGAFLEERQHLRPVEAIGLGGLYETIRARDDVRVRLTDIAAIIVPPEGARAVTPASPRELVSAIDRVQAWGVSLMVQRQLEDLDGFPVFWDREHGHSVPFGPDVGSMAAADTLALWAEAATTGIAPDPTDHEETAIRRALRQLIDLGRPGSSGWYAGAIEFDAFDDDFVGSFLKEEAARGACPTLEAGAERLVVLAQLAREAEQRAWDEHAEIVEAIQEAAGHVLRWQAPDGGWAIHRYEPGSPYELPTRDFSSRYGCDALAAALARDLLGVDLASRARQALSRYADLLRSTATTDDSQAWWADDFTQGGVPSMRATCMAAIGLGQLAEVLDDSELLVLQGAAVEYLLSVWTPDPTRELGSEFRCPTWSGPALNLFSWEPPRDALLLLAVVDHARRGGDISQAIATIHEATGLLLETEQDGSWLDAVMLKEGMHKAFSSNTLHCERALLAVLAWQLEPISATVLERLTSRTSPTS